MELEKSLDTIRMNIIIRVFVSHGLQYTIENNRMGYSQINNGTNTSSSLIFNVIKEKSYNTSPHFILNGFVIIVLSLNEQIPLILFRFWKKHYIKIFSE